MGWTFVHKEKDKTILEFFKGEFNGEHSKVVDCAVVNLKTAYLAYEITRPDKPRQVVGIVCLLDYVPKDWFNFGYKDVEESMGPCECDCPEKILKQLTSDDLNPISDWASKWRQKCWQNIEQKKARPSLKGGLLIRFERSISFQDGAKSDTFIVEDARKQIFVCAKTHRRYKIRRNVLNSIPWDHMLINYKLCIMNV